MLSSGYESWPTSSYLTASGSETESSSGYEAYPTGSESSTSAEFQPYPTDSEVSSSAAETTHTMVTPTYSSEVTDEGPETVTSYVDVMITSCPPEVQACATMSGEGSPAASSLSVESITSLSPSSMVAGSVSSSPSPGIPPYSAISAGPTQNTEAMESYTTVITTHYIGICPTGYTTIPYTTTMVTASGANSTPSITPEVPAGFTTTVAVCPACDSTSPTVTLTIPVVSVVPVPVPTEAPSEVTPPAGSSPAGSSPAGSSPAGSSPAGSSPAGSSPAGSSPAGSSPAGSSPAGYSPAGSSPAGSAAEVHATVSPSSESSLAGDSTLAGYGSSASATQTSSFGPAGYTSAYPTPPLSSAPPATGVSPYSTVSDLGYPDAVPTTANPPYDAGNVTLSFQTAPASAGSQKTGASKGLSGAEATRPAPYTGGASEVGKGTFVAAVVAATWAGLLVV
jgi:chitinase